MPGEYCQSKRVSTQDPPAAAAALDGGIQLAAARFGRYLEAERGRSAHTVRAYLSDVESLLAHAATEGVHDLAGLELGTLRRWLGAQSESGKSRATLARRAATARAFTAWAVREELIEADPALRLKAPKREKSLPGVLHQQQVRRLVDDAESASAEGEPLALRNRAMVELLYATGVRVGELAGMDVDDLDPDRRTLRVLGKGNKERTVPYGLPAALAVDDWLRRGRPALATGTSGPALFLGARGGRVDQRQVRSVVKEMLDGWGHRRHRAARPAALRSDPPARRRGGPARRAGNPRAQQPCHHPDLHPRVRREAPAELPAGAPPGLRIAAGASGRPERRTIRPGSCPGFGLRPARRQADQGPPAGLPNHARRAGKTRRIALA